VGWNARVLRPRPKERDASGLCSALAREFGSAKLKAKEVRMFVLRALTALFGLFGHGRSPAMLFNLLAPRAGYRVERDIAYGDLPRNRLDLYLPLKLEAPAPVLLFFYGGGFVAGHKSEYRIFGEAFASLGILTAVADYRIHPEAKFPNFLEDGAKAASKLRAIAERFGGDPGRLFLAGHSAGAYIAVMLAADPRYLERAGCPRSALRGAIGIAGAYGKRPFDNPVVHAIFGADRRETEPLNYIAGDEPPMLLAVGARDGLAQRSAARELASRIRSARGEVEEIEYPGIGHSGILLSLAPRFRHRTNLRADIARFVHGH
jgi:acetyl esterase/lipase